MRSAFLLAFVSVALGSVAACAASGDEPARPPALEDSDAGLPVTDAGDHEADAESDAPAPLLPTCTDSGFCTTSLPDADLMFKDIWPLPGRAFAVAESKTLGVKVLEWEDATGAWKYIDDDSQNEPGFGDHVGRMWAPDENEVYFTVSPGTLYHGVREAPSKPFAWTRHQFEDHSPDQDPTHEHGHPLYRNQTFYTTQLRYPSLGVWGFGRDDVYAWYANTIYHWTSVDGGPPEWTAEYTATDVDSADEHLYVVAAAGLDRDDVWFSLARDSTSLQSACSAIVRKTASGYERIADGIVGMFRMCRPRDGYASIGGTNGWLTDLQAQGSNQLVGLKGARDVVRITVSENDVAIATKPVPYDLTIDSTPLTSLWSAPDERLWVSGWGAVGHGADTWDGGSFQLATISLNGAPLNRPMYQVRGTSSSNVWAIGVRYAFHKTTP